MTKCRRCGQPSDTHQRCAACRVHEAARQRTRRARLVTERGSAGCTRCGQIDPAWLERRRQHRYCFSCRLQRAAEERRRYARLKGRAA